MRRPFRLAVTFACLTALGILTLLQACAPVQPAVAPAVVPATPVVVPAASATAGVQQASPSPAAAETAAKPESTPTPGPAGSGAPEFGIKDLVGWWWGSTGMYLKFADDGTYQNGGLEKSSGTSWDAGQFELSGSRVTLRSSGDSPTCAGLTGAYRLDFKGEGRFRFQLIDDPCQPRATTAHYDLYFRQPADVGWPDSAATPVAVWRTEDLAGLWKSSRVLLQVSENGTFRSARTAADLQAQPNDLGLVALNGAQVKLVSNSESALCPGQTGTYKFRIGEAAQLYLTVIDDPCQKRKASFSGAGLLRQTP